jgi:glycosyltransferase involved in cell wall biosynthesis
MTRVQFFGDLAATGFGSVTMDLGRAMLARGDDVRFVSLNEVADLPEPFASRTFNVGQADGWIATPTTPEEAALMQFRIVGLFSGASWPDGWTPEAAIFLGDFEAVRQGVMPAAIEQARIPMFHYCPVEGIDLPPRWGSFWANVRPIAMSEFGATEIERVTGSRPPVVYHGVDTETFYPVSPERPIVMPMQGGLTVLRSKNDCKRFWGADHNRTWLFRSDRHMPRKRYSSLFRALAPVLMRNPDVDLVYHCRTSDQGGNLDDAKSKFRPDIAARMISTGLNDQFGGVDRRALNALYNAADIYVSVSAEGFGLTIAEAMAAGVPAVGLGYSAVPEVIGAEVPDPWTEPYVEGAGGLIVRPGGLVDNPYDHFWAAVDEQAFGQAVEHLVAHRKRRRELGWLASRHVATTFSWATAARQFADIITERVAVAA